MVDNKYVIGIADMKMAAVQGVLAEIDLGEEGMVALVTGDGREICSGTVLGETGIYGELSFARENKEENSGAEMISYGGENWLFTFSEVEETGSLAALAAIAKLGTSPITIMIAIIMLKIRFFIFVSSKNRLYQYIFCFQGRCKCQTNPQRI